VCIWWLVIALLVIGLAVITVLVSRPMRIPRDQSREGAEDEASSQAYYRTSRWPLFVFERYLILKALGTNKPNGWLVDVGCGPGFLTAKISQKYKDNKVVGLDNSILALENAKRTWPADLYPELNLIIGDAQRLPFSDNSVEFIISSLSLHHWPDAGGVFQEIIRTLKPGGKFLIFDLRRDSPRYVYLALKIGQAFLAPKAIRMINGAVGSFWSAYTPDEIIMTIQNIPLKNLRIESHFGWMFISGIKTEKL
jgi:ubiquinone/menaquinone biosynthesis C-methylase UbiE